MIVARVVAILVIGLLLSAQSAPQLDLETDFNKSVLIISANENACYRFDVYLALNRAQQMQGLMFVRNMPDTTGMLFAYSQARHLSMWMKNTYISLDILLRCICKLRCWRERATLWFREVLDQGNNFVTQQAWHQPLQLALLQGI